MDDKNSQGAPHDNLTPIPGVTYLIQLPNGNKYDWQYAPKTAGDPAPWRDHEGMNRMLTPLVAILGVVYNPHPPTRTEWGIKHLEHDCPSEHIGRITSYGDSRQLMNEEFPNDGHYVRVARQVTETEWKEVTDV